MGPLVDHSVHLWTLRDRKVVRWQGYAGPEDPRSRRAVGSRAGGFFRDGVPAHCATGLRKNAAAEITAPATERDTERAMSRIQIAAALAVSAVAAVAVLTLTAGRDEPTPRHGDAAAAAEPEPEAVRRCKTAVYGELDPEWRKRAVVAGPLALLPYLERRPELFVPDAELKVIAVVRSGASVTLAVPEAERQRISLLYDSGGPRLNRLFRLSDGTSSVRFIACSRGRETQFNGGFFVRDAHCAAIEVWTEGRTNPIRRWLPVGVSDRACPP